MSPSDRCGWRAGVHSAPSPAGTLPSALARRLRSRDAARRALASRPLPSSLPAGCPARRGRGDGHPRDGGAVVHAGVTGGNRSPSAPSSLGRWTGRRALPRLTPLPGRRLPLFHLLLPGFGRCRGDDPAVGDPQAGRHRGDRRFGWGAVPPPWGRLMARAMAGGRGRRDRHGDPADRRGTARSRGYPQSPRPARPDGPAGGVSRARVILHRSKSVERFDWPARNPIDRASRRLDGWGFGGRPVRAGRATAGITPYRASVPAASAFVEGASHRWSVAGSKAIEARTTPRRRVSGPSPASAGQ